MLLRDNIYSAIRHAILTLEFEPGQELREQVLAERYHVSRSPIRDALLRLEQDGFVTVLPRQGYRVNTISLSDIEAMYEVYVLVEPACAAGAARADDATVATLDRFRGFVEDDGSFLAYIDYNRSFHIAMAGICGNPRLAAIEQELTEEFHRLIRYTLRSVETFVARPLVLEHDAIIDAIQAHDAQKAAQLSQAHTATRLLPVIVAFRNGVEANNISQEPVAAVE